MNMVVKFKHDAFKKGVNDALTLAPLREVIRDVLKDSHAYGKNVVVQTREPGRAGNVSHGKATGGKR